MPQDKELGATGASQVFTGGPNETAIAETFTHALVEGKPLADDGSLYSTVQDAENAASSWVFVPPGTFNESVTIDTTGLTLVGSGYDTFIDGGTTGTAVTMNATDVTVSNLSVASTSGAGNSYYGIFLGDSRATVKNIVVRESDSTGIRSGNGSDQLIVNCRVEQADNEGMYITTTPTIVYGCIVKSTGSHGIYQRQDDQIVANCIVMDTGNDGLYEFEGVDCIRIGNRVINPGGDAIEINSADNIVANNRVSGGGINDKASSTVLDGNNSNAAN